MRATATNYPIQRLIHHCTYFFPTKQACFLNRFEISPFYVKLLSSILLPLVISVVLAIACFVRSKLQKYKKKLQLDSLDHYRFMIKCVVVVEVITFASFSAICSNLLWTFHCSKVFKFLSLSAGLSILSNGNANIFFSSVPSGNILA